MYFIAVGKGWEIDTQKANDKKGFQLLNNKCAKTRKILYCVVRYWTIYG